MPWKVYRIVKRDALSTERLLEVLLRMCPTCDEKAFDAYFGDTQHDEVPLAFCESCPFNRPPEGTEDGCAYPLVDYLCWTYICDTELLPHVLAVHNEQLDELLQGQVLVVEKGGRTKELNYAGLVTADDDTQLEREDSRPPTAETPPPDESNHAHTVNAIPDIRRPSTSSNENVIGAYAPINENCEEGPHADEGLLPVDQRRRGTTKLLSLTVEEPAAPPPATRQRLPRKNASASSKIHRVELRPTSKYPHRAIQKPIPMARRGNPNAAPYSNPVERPKTGRRLDPTKQAASTNRWAATDELCAHRNCRNPYENESIIPEGEEIAWVECDRCSEWYHCICVLGRNRSPRAGSEFICNARRCL